MFHSPAKQFDQFSSLILRDFDSVSVSVCVCDVCLQVMLPKSCLSPSEKEKG